MENIQQINEENNKNILEGTLLDNILQQHNVGIVINEKVYADRKKADGRDDWVKKRDTIVSNLQHEINYFNLKDEEKRKAYLDYWGKEKSLNDPIKSGEKGEWQDWIVDKSLDQELYISQKQELDEKKISIT